MYTGTLINELIAIVEQAEAANQARYEQSSNARSVWPSSDMQSSAGLEPEKLPEALGLGAADGDLSLLLVVHAQLVRALKPRYNFADPVDVHQVGTMRPPE